MKTNKKYYITFGIMAAVVLALIVSLVSVVLAYTQQTVTTRLNINYTTVDVDGSVEATYTIGNSTNYLQRADGQGTKITFNAEDTSNQNASLVFPTEQINLTSTNKSMVLRYMFTNTGSNVYSAIMSLSGLSQTNMKLEFSLDGEAYTESQYALVVRNTGISNYYIKVTVVDVAHNASFSGDISWLLENYVPSGEETEISMTSSTFTLNEETQTYSASYNGEALTGGKYIVPSYIGSVPVTEIVKNENVNKDQVTSVFIPATIETIGDYAFYGYSYLKTVSFEEPTARATSNSATGLKTIGDRAFAFCHNLLSLQIPASVETIGGSFVECTGCLPSDFKVTFAQGSKLKELKDETFMLYSGNELELPEGLTTVGGDIFGSSSTTKVIVPGSVTSVAEGAFDYVVLANEGEVILKVAEGTTEIASRRYDTSENDSMLIGLSSVTKIILPEGLSSIGAWAFAGLSSLKECNIPASVTSIDRLLFYECTSLERVVFEDTVGWTYMDSSLDVSDPEVCAQNLKPDDIGEILWVETPLTKTSE